MSQIDPRNVVVFVRDSSDAVVRIGVSSWLEPREAVRTVEADDKWQFKDVETQVSKAMSADIVSS